MSIQNPSPALKMLRRTTVMCIVCGWICAAFDYKGFLAILIYLLIGYVLAVRKLKAKHQLREATKGMSK